ncbi:MAG: hypothetical protein HZC54_00825 [Verrucomicrobia bacterium]|nr:hypothetical protein [Verrucomicrobiota bacterium]
MSTTQELPGITAQWQPVERLYLVRELAAVACVVAEPARKTRLAETIHALASWEKTRLEACREAIMAELAEARVWAAEEPEVSGQGAVVSGQGAVVRGQKTEEGAR